MSAAGVRASVAEPPVAPGLGLDRDVPVDDADPRRRVGSAARQAEKDCFQLNPSLPDILLYMQLSLDQTHSYALYSLPQSGITKSLNKMLSGEE